VKSGSRRKPGVDNISEARRRPALEICYHTATNPGPTRHNKGATARFPSRVIPRPFLCLGRPGGGRPPPRCELRICRSHVRIVQGAPSLQQLRGTGRAWRERERRVLASTTAPATCSIVRPCAFSRDAPSRCAGRDRAENVGWATLAGRPILFRVRESRPPA